MKRLTLLIPLFFLTFILTRCTYNNEEDLYGENPSGSCDTENVTYAGTIKPILTDNCYSCHSSSNANSFGAGINLETFNQLLTVVNNGKLLGAISHSPGFPKMPQGSAKLDDCTIEKIKTWIENGATNN